MLKKNTSKSIICQPNIAFMKKTLPISLTAALIEDSWILIRASALSLLAVCDFEWCVWKKFWLHTDMRNISTVFSGSCGFSSVILHQNLTRESFLQVSCNVESQSVSIGFHTITLNWVGLSGTLNSFTMHDFLTPYTNHLETIDPLRYDFLSVSKYYIKKSPLLISLSHQKNLKSLGKLSSSLTEVF